MTPAEIAEMQADALAGTPGEWDWETESGDWEQQTLEGSDPVLWWDYDLGFRFGMPSDARRIARVPRLEAAVTAQAAEIERLREALEPFVYALKATNEGFGFDVSDHYETANVVCAPYIRMKHFVAARAALEAKP